MNECYSYPPRLPTVCHAISAFIDKGTETRWQGSFFALFLFSFIYFGLLCVSVAVHGLSLVAASGGDSRCGARALEGAASVVTVRGLSRRSSMDT